MKQICCAIGSVCELEARVQAWDRHQRKWGKAGPIPLLQANNHPSLHPGILLLFYVSKTRFPQYRCFVPESVWAQGSSNSGGLYLIFSSSHLLIFTPSLTPSHLHLLIFTSSHLHIFSHTFSSSHLLIFTSSHLLTSSHTFSSSHLLSHLLIFTSAHLHIFSSSHLLIFTPSHLHICSSSHLLFFIPSLTPSHLHTFSHTFSSSHLSLSLSLLFPLSFLSLLSLSLFSLSPSLSFSL